MPLCTLRHKSSHEVDCRKSLKPCCYLTVRPQNRQKCLQVLVPWQTFLQGWRLTDFFLCVCVCARVLQTFVSCSQRKKSECFERFTMYFTRVVNHSEQLDDCSRANKWKWEWVSVNGILGWSRLRRDKLMGQSKLNACWWFCCYCFCCCCITPCSDIIFSRTKQEDDQLSWKWKFMRRWRRNALARDFMMLHLFLLPEKWPQDNLTSDCIEFWSFVVRKFRRGLGMGMGM